MSTIIIITPPPPPKKLAEGDSPVTVDYAAAVDLILQAQEEGATVRVVHDA